MRATHNVLAVRCRDEEDEVDERRDDVERVASVGPAARGEESQGLARGSGGAGSPKGGDALGQGRLSTKMSQCVQEGSMRGSRRRRSGRTVKSGPSAKPSGKLQRRRRQRQYQRFVGDFPRSE